LGDGRWGGDSCTRKETERHRQTDREREKLTNLVSSVSTQRLKGKENKQRERKINKVKKRERKRERESVCGRERKRKRETDIKCIALVYLSMYKPLRKLEERKREGEKDREKEV
jgi:hypothetical protein